MTEYTAYYIDDSRDGSHTKMEPLCYEDAMNPGSLKVVPVDRVEDEGGVTITDGFEAVWIPREDLESGSVTISEKPFAPVLKKQKKRNCAHCTNCGGCSY